MELLKVGDLKVNWEEFWKTKEVQTKTNIKQEIQQQKFKRKPGKMSCGPKYALSIHGGYNRILLGDKFFDCLSFNLS